MAQIFASYQNQTCMVFVRRRRLVSFRSGSLVAMLVAAFAYPAAASAQKDKVHRVAFVATTSPPTEIRGNPYVLAFVSRLRELGYVEGRNLTLDFRTLEGRFERIPEILTDIVRLKPDVIFTATQLVGERHLQATAGIPVVTIANWSLLKTGIVESLARPGGSVTGFIVDVDAEVEAKRLELLQEVVPGLKRIAYLGIPITWESPAGTHVRDAARRLRLSLFHAAYTGTDVQAASAVIETESADAVFVPVGTVSLANRQRIGELVAARRLPCIAGSSELAESGCLMSYGVDSIEVLRGAAGYVAKILEGAKPGDLPIQQPTKFELVINMKAARALGLTIPRAVLLRADRVIE
jgi:putative tryptophan/tyrosine transport system substrate-binding protein